MQVTRELHDLSQVVRRIQEAFLAEGVDLSDMRRAGSLEVAGNFGGQDPYEPLTDWPLTIERLEGPIRPIPVAVAAPGGSRLRYFLDGSQRTLPVWRVGVVPVIASITVAGVLERDTNGRGTILADTLRLNHTWLFPTQTGMPQLDQLRLRIEDAGGTVRDPLAKVFDRSDDPEQAQRHYLALAGNYGRLVHCAQKTAGEIREKLEADILFDWQAHQADSDDWIVVDGRLRQNVPRALGLVKELLTQHLAGPEAEALFNLPVGHRTSAFRYVSTGRDEEGEVSGTGARTMWYLRLWDAAGLDARHALVRIEASNDVDAPEEIDRLSSWLLAERIPRATQDPRWATLLYPIHYLEQILKRRVAGVTAGWPP
ncbi:MAG: hypothetical protein M3121_04820 [Chloroflexota bacterium]|nr:hypothetical protein [Chloroflexota bacterium]